MSASNERTAHDEPGGTSVVRPAAYRAMTRIRASRPAAALPGPLLLAAILMHDRGSEYSPCKRCSELTRFVLVVGLDGYEDRDEHLSLCASCIADFLTSTVRA